MVNYCRVNGIIPDLTHTYSSWENGVAERKNRTLLESARCLLIASNRAKHLWEDAVAAACYVRNRTPCSTNPKWKTPFELRFGRIPDISNLKVWGCKAMVQIPNAKVTDKLSPRSRLCIFVGYSSQDSTRAYTFITDTGGYIYSANASFDESEIIRRSLSSDTPYEAEDTTSSIKPKIGTTTLKRPSEQAELKATPERRQSSRLMKAAEGKEAAEGDEIFYALLANYLNEEPGQKVSSEQKDHLELELSLEL